MEDNMNPTDNQQVVTPATPVDGEEGTSEVATEGETPEVNTDGVNPEETTPEVESEDEAAN